MLGAHDGYASDEGVMRALAEALAPAEGVDARMLGAAKAAFSWRTVDAEIEMLSVTYDSVMEPVALFRGAADEPSRMLIFDSPNSTLELQVGTEVLMGQVVPPEHLVITLESPRGVVAETETDGAGVFLLRRQSWGPSRLRWRSGPGAVSELVTDWVPM
jgi:extradiol dioxygenase family protein